MNTETRYMSTEALLIKGLSILSCTSEECNDVDDREDPKKCSLTYILVIKQFL